MRTRPEILSVPRKADPTARCHARHAFALLLALLLIAFLTAVTAEVVTLTASEAVVQDRRDQTLAHELAVDSTLLLLADALHESPGHHSTIVRDLDHGTAPEFVFTVGQVGVKCRLTDDGARFNPIGFQRDDQEGLLTRKLTLIASRLPLPAAKIRLRPIADHPGSRSDRRFRWFDQLLGDAQPGAVFDWTPATAEVDPRSVWSDVLTLWGDGRIDVRRVAEPVLESLLEDIRPGLARGILAGRKNDRSIDFRPAALAKVDGEVRTEVAARLAFDLKRYSVRLDTVIGADRRRWFIVASIRDDIQVHHRSQLGW